MPRMEQVRVIVDGELFSFYNHFPTKETLLASQYSVGTSTGNVLKSYTL